MMSPNRTLCELEAQKKRLELERRMIQVELELLKADQEINTLRSSQTPTQSAKSIEVPIVKLEEEPIFVPDDIEATTEDSSLPKNFRSISQQQEIRYSSDQDKFPNFGRRKLLRPLTETKPMSSHPLLAIRHDCIKSPRSLASDAVSTESLAAQKHITNGVVPLAQNIHPISDTVQKEGLWPLPMFQATEQEFSRSTKDAVTLKRGNPFLTSPSPSGTRPRDLLRRKRPASQELNEIHSLQRRRLKRSSNSNTSRKCRISSQGHDATIADINKKKRIEQQANDSSNSEESNELSTGGESGTPSLLAEAGDIDTNVPRAQRRRHIPQGGYQTLEYRRMTASERRQLELRYCVHILLMIQQKSCVRKPPLPLSKENLFDRCKRRFPEAVLTNLGNSDNEIGALSFKQQRVKAGTKTADLATLDDMLKDGDTNRQGEPLYRTANDFLDHVKVMLHEYVRMGTCDNCPFARDGGKQSARVMCWRMRLESVIEERMRGLKTCMKRCDELAGNLEGRKEIVDEWFGNVEDDDD